MRTINEIVVHCTATPEGRAVPVAEIRRWHKGRGWSDIGYHYVVGLNGQVHVGRPVERKGAHVKGRNTGTIGVAYVGGVAQDGKTPKDTRTYAQKVALRDLLKRLLKEHSGVKLISGHRDYAAKACPSFPARREYADLTRNPAPSTAKVPDERIRYLQKLLAMAGHYTGQHDGIVSEKTEAGLKAFQRSAGLPETGAFDKPTVARLRLLEQRDPAVEDLIAASEKTVTESTTIRSQGLQWVFGGGGATIITVFGERLPTWAFTGVAIAMVAGVAYFGWHIISERRDKARMARAASVGPVLP